MGFGTMLILIIVLSVIVWIPFNAIREKAREEVTQSNYTQNQQVLMGFNPSIIKSIGDYSFLISEESKKLAIRYDGCYWKIEPVKLDIDTLSSFEITQDNAVISSGGIGRAVVGGVLAGGAGAVVGANTAKKIKEVSHVGVKFTTKDIQNPMIRVDLYGETEKLRGISNPDKYSPKVIIRQLEELVAILGIIQQQ